MRPLTLVLETATRRGSVALLGGGAIRAVERFDGLDVVAGARREALAPAIAAVLARAGVAPAALGGVVVDAGPGGFTSLRNAAALAKGLCAALAIPLHAVGSLELLAWSAALPDGQYTVAVDAGRGEWFASAATVTGTTIDVAPPRLVRGADLAAPGDRATVGPGLDIDASPDAAAVLPYLERVFEREGVALDSWEPDYGRMAEAQARWEAAHGRALTP